MRRLSADGSLQYPFEEEPVSIASRVGSVVRAWLPRRAVQSPIALAIMMIACVTAPATRAAEWGFAAEAGPVLAAKSGTPFVFRLTPYRMMAPEFSLGPSVYVSPAGDALLYTAAVLAQFHARRDGFEVVPFFGIGFAHRRSDNDHDTAFLFPFGASLDLGIDENLFVRGTASVNIHAIELDGENDTASLGLTFGINYLP